MKGEALHPRTLVSAIPGYLAKDEDLQLCYHACFSRLKMSCDSCIAKMNELAFTIVPAPS